MQDQLGLMITVQPLKVWLIKKSPFNGIQHTGGIPDMSLTEQKEHSLKTSSCSLLLPSFLLPPFFILKKLFSQAVK